MIYFILVIVIVVLFISFMTQRKHIQNLTLQESGKLLNIQYNRFNASAEEIANVEKQIAEKGFWAEQYEWKLMTATQCIIEPRFENERAIFWVSVKCEHKIEFPAGTIERAIVFRKIYEALQQSLYYNLGWSSHKSKDDFS